MNNYILELTHYLDEMGVSDKEHIIEKYRKRFEMGLEAGLTEKEIVDKLESPKTVAANYKKFQDENDVKFENRNTNENNQSEKLIQISKLILEEGSNVFISGLNQNIIVEPSEDIYSYVLVSENIISDVTMDNSQDRIKANYKFKGILNKNTRSGQIVVRIQQGLSLNKIDVKSVSKDISYNLLNSVKKVELDNVSGDINITDCYADICDAHTISGHISAKKLMVINGEFNSVSGNFKIENSIIKILKSTTISGKIVFDGNEDVTLDGVSTLSGKLIVNGERMPSTLSKCKATINGVFGTKKGKSV